MAINYLGVIPARGGSKGIPKKNIKTIAGKPLIGWTIDSVKKSRLLDDCIVSTDSAEIKFVAETFGVKVQRRPDKLAQDTSLIIDTLRYVIDTIDCNNIVMLQPTSPVRRDNLIDMCIQKHIDNKVETVVTGFNCYYKEYCEEFIQRRQDIKPFFYDDGNVYVFTREMIDRGNIKSNNNMKVYTSLFENFEVDDLQTWKIVEKILEEGWRNNEGT